MNNKIPYKNMIKNSTKTSLVLALISIFSLASYPASASIQFQDISASAGISYSSETWGGQWGDINGDYRPDLFINNHRNRPNFYRNNGDGTFTDIALQIMDWPTWMDMEFYDLHGGAFGDIDNDGDADLFIRTGSNVRNLLFVNENGVLNERGNTNGIGLSKSGKATLMLDYNNDGLLDIITGSGNWKGSANATFTDANTEIQNTCEHLTNTLIATDYNDDGTIEVLCGLEGSFPRQVLDTETLPFAYLTSDFPTVPLTNNILAADLDNDLDIDVFLTRGFLRPTEAALVTPTKMESWLQGSSTKSKGLEFETDDPITITTDSTFFDQRTDIYIGANEVHPTSASGFGGKLTFTLSPLSPDVDGISTITNGNNRIHIGRVNGAWKIEIPMTTNTTRGYITIESSQNINNLATFGTGINDVPISNTLLINTPTGFNDETSLHGLDSPVSCVSPVAADFDNDMDLDLYLACTGSVANYANRVYINDGQGVFTEQVSHGGEGATGVGLESKVGTADSALTADFDLDGRVDIALVNGMGLRPLHVGGPQQLIRNTSVNTNNWIQLIPVGTVSNRDAIGAKLFATTNDGKVQLRELNQNHQRWGHSDKTIHFGLGQNTQVTINIEWPSGETDTFTDLDANKLYTLTENGLAEAVTLEAVPSVPTAEINDACGAPVFYDDITDIQVLWKNCSTNTWFLRATRNGTNTTRVIAGNIISDQQIQNIVNISIEQDDSVDNTSDKSAIDFTLNIIDQDSDGFDFSVADDAQTCFTVTDPVDILIGPNFKKTGTRSFNLSTFEPCDSVTIPGTPWNETFSDLTDGTLRDIGDTAWTSLRSSGQYGVSNQQFQIAGAGTETTWQSSIINVAGLSEFHIKTEISGTTGLDINNDSVQVSYSIDGQPEVIANTHTATLTTGNPVQLISDDLSGNTIQVTIRATVTDTNEVLNINSVNVLPESGIVITPAIPPVGITITEDINNDGMISSSEVSGLIDTSVTLSAGMEIGDVVSVTDGNGNIQSITLTAVNLTGPVTASFPNPGDGGSISASATTTNTTGSISSAVNDSALVDISALSPSSITITEDINNDGSITNDELTGAIDINVALPAGLNTGDIVTISDGNGNNQSITLTASNLAGPLLLSLSNPGDGGTINASAIISDGIGNISNSVTDTATVNTGTVIIPAIAPVSIIINEDINNDGAINSNELSGLIDVSVTLPAGMTSGYIVSIVDGNGNTENTTLTNANLAGPITASFPNPGDGGSINASATTINTTGSISSAVNDSALVDISVLSPSSITITEDINNDGSITDDELNGMIDINVVLPAGLSTGDTVTVSDGNGNNQDIVLTATNLAGPISLNVSNPGNGGIVNASAIVSDGVGNTSSVVSDSATVSTGSTDTGSDAGGGGCTLSSRSPLIPVEWMLLFIYTLLRGFRKRQHE